MSNFGDVILVHCVDTEGPLYETIPATFERIRKAFGLNLEPSEERLSKLKKGIGVPDKIKQQIIEFVSDDRLNYNKSWSEVDSMMHELMSNNWRMKYSDDFGQGYIFSWFILDYVGLENNPRNRAMGYHAIYNHYRDYLDKYTPKGDSLYWHYHPTSYFFEAHKSSNNFSFTNQHVQILNRRVIDKLDFPSAYRPCCHCERADINLFLEMWIPFDFGNQGMPERPEDKAQLDISGGRYGDWRRATYDWEVYHPDFYDYQKKGSMKRYIARCLNLRSRLRPISVDEIRKAFQRASTGKNTILAVTNHDHSEMRHHIDENMKLIRDVQKEFGGEILIRHSNAVDAIRQSEKISFKSPLRLSFKWSGNLLDIKSDSPVWGTQPWFCFKTKDNRYIFENLDFQGDNNWSFVFDDDFICLDQIESIGIAANDSFGNTSVYKLSPDKILNNTVSKFNNIPKYK